MRLVFAGTPHFAATILARLLDTDHQVAAVLTQPDRRAGRGKSLKASPVKRLASEAGLSVLQPERLGDEQSSAMLEALAPRCIVVAAYGLLLPQRVLQLPPLGCINVHASLLPRWRGAAPIQRAIEAGDHETGVSIMQMERGLDTGPVFLRRTLPIGDEDTAGTLHDALAALGADALLEALDGIADGRLQAARQDDALATYAHKLEKHEARIDWQADCRQLARRIRAFNPWPVAWTELPSARAPRGGARLRVLSGQPLSIANDQPAGTVVRADATGVVIACGQGQLRLGEVQRAGGQPMPSADALRGLRLEPGDCFE